MKKFYIVGSGIVGSVIAHELAERGGQVEVIERRNHTGGNLYDYTNEYGIHVHEYGPHIFHTKNHDIWNYVTRFAKWNDYNLVCGAVIDGKCVPTAFDFTSVDVFFPEEAELMKEHIRMTAGDKKSATVLEMLESEDEYVRKFAQFLYEKDYQPYTAKQWGIPPEQVNKSIFKRVPIMLSYGSKYFDDPYQAMPVNGYMEMIKNLLDHPNIKVKTKTEALTVLSIENNDLLINGEKADGTVIYTGAIDELFGCKFGKLPYRSLRFEWKYEDIDSFQDMPVVAYPQAEGYTRITEYKKLPHQDVKGTTYAVEYPLPYKQGESYEPYYPGLTDDSQVLYDQYRKLADNIQNLICCGRLADVKYYNIDQAIERALDVVKNIEV